MRKLRWGNHKYHIELLREYYTLNKYCWTEQLKDAILDAIDCLIYVDECQKMEDGILNATTVDAVPVVHGEWIDRIVDNGEIINPWDNRYKCSQCGDTFRSSWFNFCPTCGAKMDGAE